MLCHICGEPASLLQCPECRLAACRKHIETLSSSRHICSACANREREAARKVAEEQRRRAQEQKDWDERARYCDFCQGPIAVHSNVCAKCNRRFCEQHGKLEGNREKGWSRCQEHKVGFLTRLFSDLPDYDHSSKALTRRLDAEDAARKKAEEAAMKKWRKTWRR